MYKEYEKKQRAKKEKKARKNIKDLNDMEILNIERRMRERNLGEKLKDKFKILNFKNKDDIDLFK